MIDKLEDRLFELLHEQKKYYIRLCNGNKHITIPRMWFSSEEELNKIQRKIGAQNKKIIINECKRDGLEIPNFRKEIND